MTRDENPDYADFVNTFGDGAKLENGAEIARDLLSTTTEKNDIVNFVFPDAVLRDPEACLARRISSPTNEQVEEYNSAVLDRIDGESKRYFAADRPKDVSEPAHQRPSRFHHPPDTTNATSQLAHQDKCIACYQIARAIGTRAKT